MSARTLLTLAALAAGGCAVDNPAAARPALDEAMFACRVEPVLVERCGFPSCHGAPGRTFRVYGPGRTRLDPAATEPRAPLTDDEHRANLRSALGFAGPAAGYDEPLLVEKGLAERLGGAFHGATRMFGGRSPFQDEDDPGLAALRVWLEGAAEDATCAR